MEYGFLVSVAVIILSTKILGDLTKKVSMYATEGKSCETFHRSNYQ